MVLAPPPSRLLKQLLPHTASSASSRIPGMKNEAEDGKTFQKTPHCPQRTDKLWQTRTDPVHAGLHSTQAKSAEQARGSKRLTPICIEVDIGVAHTWFDDVASIAVLLPLGHTNSPKFISVPNSAKSTACPKQEERCQDPSAYLKPKDSELSPLTLM